MEITVGGHYLDLIQDKDVTMNFTIQQTKDLSRRLVDFSSSFAIPKTQHNVSILSPLLANDWKITDVSVTFDSGFQMDCVMYVERETELKFGDVYSVRLVSKLSDMLKQIRKDTLGVLASSQYDFKYIFRDDASYNVPADPTQSDWFIVAPNRNGDDYGDTDYPIYSARMIDGGHSDMYIGISVARFLNAVFAYYQIPRGFDFSTELMDGVTIDDVYIFFSTQFITLDDRTLEFNLDTATVQDSDGNDIQVTKIVSPPDATRFTDKLQHLALQPDKVTGTADTIFDIVVNSNAKFSFSIYDSEGTVPDYSGKIIVQLGVFIDDAIHKAVNITELTTTDTAVQFPAGGITIPNVKLQATSEITFKLIVRFQNFCIIDGQGCTECADGVLLNYTEMGFPQKLVVPMQAQCTSSDGQPLDVYIDFSKTEEQLEVTMQDKQNLSPATRLELLSPGATQMEIETVSMSKTLDNTEIKIIDVLRDILQRFNIGFYLKSDGSIGLSAFPNRYNSTEFVGVAEWDDGFEVHYLDNSLGKFSYKNKMFDIKDIVFEDEKNDKHTYGDVLEQDFGGDHDESVSLRSGILTSKFYKEDYRDLSNDEFDMISVRDPETNDDYPREFFGIPYNEPSDDKVGDFFFGFISDNWKSAEVYIPLVQFFNYNDGTAQINKPVVTFSKDAKMLYYDTATNPQQPAGNPISFLTPLFEKNGISLKLGDDINHEVDETTRLYKNFIPIFKRNRSFLDIKMIMTSSNLRKILDGALIRLLKTDGTTETYYPTSVNGVLLNREACVSEIKMISTT